MNKIPQNLEEAILRTINTIISTDDNIKLIKSDTSENIVSKVHHTYGRQIRNEWGLWSGSKLKDDLLSIGLTHPDDMSSVIILCAIRDIRKEPRLLTEQIEHYKNYWNNVSVNKL